MAHQRSEHYLDTVLTGPRRWYTRTAGLQVFVTAACICVALALGACGEAKSIHLVDTSNPGPAANATTAAATSPVADPRPSRGDAPASTSSSSATGGSESAPDAGSNLSVNRAIGQMLMSHVTGLTASPRLLARIRGGQVGNVILYSDNISSYHQVAALTASLQQAARAGGNPPVFIGTDQEGGPVKRLPSLPPTISAQQMGASANPFAVARSQGRATGVRLRALGINLDFAPVADIPTTSDNFLGERAFGHSQSSVVDGAGGFAQGLSEARVAGSAKHFPGLGAAGPRDTDLTVVSIDASKSQLQESYLPYISMANLGALAAPMVMISDAIYPNLDASGLPAVLSKKIVRGELAVAGMGGRVTITDDLEVPSVQQYRNAAVKAVLAGDDILMFAQHEAGSEQAYQMIRAAVANHAIPKSLVLAAANRVIQLKQELGVG